MGAIKTRIMEAAASDEQGRGAWAAWNGQREAAGEAWKRGRSRWWREKCDAEICEALSEARRGKRECLIPVSWALERVVLAEMGMTRSSGVLCASVDTVARAAGVSRRTVSRHNQTLERAGVLRRHSSGGAKFDEGGRIVATAANVYRFSHQQLRRVLGVPLRGQSVYESEKAATPAMQRMGDAVKHAFERRVVARFHVCAPGSTPWHDERGFSRMWKTPKNVSRRLWKMWKTTHFIEESPVPGRVGTVLIDKSNKKVDLQRMTCLTHAQAVSERLEITVSVLRRMGCGAIADLVGAISARSQTEALFSALDALRALRSGIPETLAATGLITERARNLGVCVDGDIP